MRGIATAVVALCVLALGACVDSRASRPPSNHAYLDMYDRPPVRARQAKRSVPASQPQETHETVGSSAPATAPKLYSSEWWTAERAREQRENERIKRAIQICHAC